jgi:prevent-host-death family protein
MPMTLPLAEARNRLSPLVASVESTHERVVITKNGRPAAVLIAIDDLEGLEETLEILSEPREVAAIREALAEPARYTLDDIRRDLEARESRRTP